MPITPKTVLDVIVGLSEFRKRNVYDAFIGSPYLDVSFMRSHIIYHALPSFFWVGFYTHTLLIVMKSPPSFSILFKF